MKEAKPRFALPLDTEVVEVVDGNQVRALPKTGKGSVIKPAISLTENGNVALFLAARQVETTSTKMFSRPAG